MNLSDITGGSAPMWVSGASFSQGKFAISPTDFNVYIRKVAGAGAIDPAADTSFTNWQPFGLSAIKSIQRVTVGIATGGANTGTATITAVNPAKCVLHNLGWSDASGTGAGAARIVLTNSTTITATNGTTGSVVSVQVVEYF